MISSRSVQAVRRATNELREEVKAALIFLD